MAKKRGKGWHKESYRHSLARRGIKTGQKSQHKTSIQKQKVPNVVSVKPKTEDLICPECRWGVRIKDGKGVGVITSDGNVRDFADKKQEESLVGAKKCRIHAYTLVPPSFLDTKLKTKKKYEDWHRPNLERTFYEDEDNIIRVEITGDSENPHIDMTAPLRSKYTKVLQEKEIEGIIGYGRQESDFEKWSEVTEQYFGVDASDRIMKFLEKDVKEFQQKAEEWDKRK